MISVAVDRESLFHEYLPLVETVARGMFSQHTMRGLDLDDAISAGNLGLLRAAQHYTAAAGLDGFEAYARTAISNAIRSELRLSLRQSGGTVPLECDKACEPDLAPADLIDLEAAIAKLSTQRRAAVRLRYGLDGQPPMTQGEIADRMGIKRQTVRVHLLEALAELRTALAAARDPSAPGL